MTKQKVEADKNIIFLSIVVIVLASFVLFNLTKKQTQTVTQNKVNQQNCLSEDCLLVSDLEYPVGDLPQTVISALDEAIKDEYKAYSTYESVIKKFGNVRPFSMIIRAEEQHISMLKSIYDKYGLTPPQNSFSGKITLPPTLIQACQTGVDAEIANAALYRDELLPSVSEYPDITGVFENLMNASQQKHLSAFEKCN